jgi:hypothetical protein
MEQGKNDGGKPVKAATAVFDGADEGPDQGGARQGRPPGERQGDPA